jgi:hypothetical protein
MRALFHNPEALERECAAMRARLRKRSGRNIPEPVLKDRKWEREESKRFGPRANRWRPEMRGRYTSEHYMGVYAPNFIYELASKMRLLMRRRSRKA